MLTWPRRMVQFFSPDRVKEEYRKSEEKRWVVGEDTLVRKKVLASKKKQERVAHAQSCGDEEKILEGRQTWDR